MWFAIFDEEFTKQTFLRDPRLYWIGLEDYCFSLKIMAMGLLKGIFNGLFIYLFVFMVMNGTGTSANGHNGSFWFSSAVLYAIVVINANMWIMQKTNSHTWFSALWAIGSILSYFLWWWFEGLYSWSNGMYEIFNDVMGQGRVWLILILALW